MRGLDTRVLMAKARIMALIDKETAEEMLIDVWIGAHATGSTDAYDRVFTPPMQFEGEPELLACWSEGQAFYLVGEEMDSCSGCNNDRGEPCHIHG